LLNKVFKTFPGQAAMNDFKNLVARHVAAAVDESGAAIHIPSDREGIIRQAFTDRRAVEE
jgi:hypothetical protein